MVWLLQKCDSNRNRAPAYAANLQDKGFADINYYMQSGFSVICKKMMVGSGLNLEGVSG